MNKLPLLSLLAIPYLVLNFSGAPAYATDADADPDADAEDAAPLQQFGASQFRIKFTRPANTFDAEEAQTLVGKLMDDMVVQGHVMAPSGSKIYGRIEKISHSRSLLKSAVSKERRFKAHAEMMMRFDKIVTPTKERIELMGFPKPEHYIFCNGTDARWLLVGRNGELLNTDGTECVDLPDFGFTLRKSLVDLKARREIDIKAGDEIIVQADIVKNFGVQATFSKSK